MHQLGSSDTSLEVASEPNVFLIGRPPITEYLGFITERTVDGQAADTRALMDAWRAANDHVLKLEEAEAGIADGVAIEDLPDEIRPLRDRILADPCVQRSFALTPIDVGMVELDRLVVFQKHINLAHIARLRTRISAPSTPQELFELCLPLRNRVDPPTGFGGGAAGWIFKSPSNDLRILGAKIVNPSQVAGLDVNGVPTQVATIAVGYSINFLAAVHVEDRLILWNGSHRAYALREAGHTHVPCLIKSVSRRDELEAMGQDDVNANPERYLTHPRPPILRDYFDEKLRLVANAKPTVRQVQVGLNLGWADLPV
jgi:hypothetical protein